MVKLDPALLDIDKLEKSLRRLAAVIKEKGREQLREYDLTPPQFIALQWVSEIEGLTISELAQKAYQAFSTTTDMIAKLEDKALIRREKDQNDKRVVRIYLTREGSRCIQSVIDQRQSFLTNRLNGLSESEALAVSRALDLLYSNICEEK